MFGYCDKLLIVALLPFPNSVTISDEHADIGWPTGNEKKVSNSQACCLAQLCLAAGCTVEIGPLSAALSASIYQICELIKTAARWRIMKKI